LREQDWPFGTCGRERVTRPHLGVAPAVRCAVLDFRTGNPCRNRSKMAETPWKMSPERQRIAGSGSYVVATNLFTSLEMGLRPGAYRRILRLSPPSHEESRRCVSCATSNIG